MPAKKPRGDSRERLQKVPATVYLDKDQAQALDDLVAVTGKSKAAYLRDAVDLVIERNSQIKRYIELLRRRRAAK